MADTSSAKTLQVNIGDIDEESIDKYQQISGRYINPAKLTAKKKEKFGTGSYEIHVSKPLLYMKIKRAKLLPRSCIIRTTSGHRSNSLALRLLAASDCGVTIVKGLIKNYGSKET